MMKAPDSIMEELEVIFLFDSLIKSSFILAEVAPKVFREYLNNPDFKEIPLGFSINDTEDLEKN